jgi:hypothetical protein
MTRPAGGDPHPVTATLLLPPLIRALTTALLVVSASAAAEVLGPFWGALIISLPVSAGPAYVFLSLQHHAGFVGAAALSSLATNAATGACLIGYAALTRRLPAPASLAAAVVVWLAGGLVIRHVAWTPFTATLLNLGVYGAGFILTQTVRDIAPAPSRSARQPRAVLAVRAIAVAMFVTAVVAVSAVLGPATTGIAAVFPVSLISLLVIVRARIGASAASLLAASALPPMLGFGLALLTLHLTIALTGVPAALCLALLVSLTWSAALLLLRRRSIPPRRSDCAGCRSR